MTKRELNELVVSRFRYLVNASFASELATIDAALAAHAKLQKQFAKSEPFTDSVNLWVVRKTLAISRAHRVFVYKAATQAELAIKKVWEAK